MTTKHFVFGFEGTLFNGSDFFPSSMKLIKKILEKNEKISILTNCSRFSSNELKNKIYTYFSTDKIQLIDPLVIITSIFKKNNIKSVFALCSDGLCQDLKNNGFLVVRPDDHPEFVHQVAENIELKNDIDSVLIGVDEGFNFCSMALAARYIVEKNSKFFVIGKDHQLLWNIENGEALFAPGAFALATPIIHGTFKDPYIIGKPNFESVREFFKDKENEDIWFIGDNLDTDIMIAHEINAKSILTLTGVSSERDIQNSEIKPTYLFLNLEDNRIFDLFKV